MNLLITVGLTFAVFALVVWGLMHMRTPRFRMERAQFQQGLEDVIAGQADDNEWRVLTGYPMRHDPPLESLRLECLRIEEDEYTGKMPYLFSDEGIRRLRDVRERLLSLPKQ
ncbi:hypothetical protein [Microbulbifer agarilyticus]|uniref:hypothetical protein n=1 Tax=Microbulbifer agarilyticus TaxID=260552 RepID=UPI001C94C9BA|nr:hypothetical protein [Microbulbifer agarilyticus]MBY6191665.1 hypothetical protein [Microbulbifer agarilyticus]MBY6212426.1 hypothetical protein [Microbulbifer agarilyticus]MCA0894043.1 hypothetical protein [Microbulbifer agarilyticus]